MICSKLVPLFLISISTQVALSAGPAEIQVVDADSLHLLTKPLSVPRYPELARFFGTQGEVALPVLISSQGVPELAGPMIGPTILQGAALDIIQKFRYQVPSRDGVPSSVQTVLHIPFQLGPGTSEDPATDVVIHPEISAKGGFSRIPEEALRQKIKAWLAKAGLSETQDGLANPKHSLVIDLKITMAGKDPVKCQCSMRVSRWENRDLTSSAPDFNSLVIHRASSFEVENQIQADHFAWSWMLGSLWQLSPQPALVPHLPAYQTIEELGSLWEKAWTELATKVQLEVSENQSLAVEFVRPTRVPPSAQYPETLKLARIQGVVKVMTLVHEEGKPTQAKATEGPKQLRDSAEKYAMDWRFSPARVNGVPIPVHYQIECSFRLR